MLKLSPTTRFSRGSQKEAERCVRLHDECQIPKSIHPDGLWSSLGKKHTTRTLTAEVARQHPSREPRRGQKHA
jgi:hypothetical protein